VGGVTSEISEADLRDAFYSYGEIASLRVVTARFCAFVTFTSRDAAERAAKGLHNKLIVKGTRMRLLWGRGQADRQQQGKAKEHDPMAPVASSSGGGAAAAAAAAAAGGDASAANYFGLTPILGPAAGGAAAYPSADPHLMGSRVHAPQPPGGVKRGPEAPPGGPGGASPEGGKRARPGPGGAPGVPPRPMAPPASGFGHPGFMMPPPGAHMMPPPGEHEERNRRDERCAVCSRARPPPPAPAPPPTHHPPTPHAPPPCLDLQA
jgi:pre-mRNA-splicing factor RBM22/SLT11